jgi:RNA polymerase sigma-70 factor (sigma-E family)
LFVGSEGIGDATLALGSGSSSRQPAADGIAAEGGLARAADGGAGDGVRALYEQTAVSLIRLAYVILSDRQRAEDVVHDAFLALYRRWGKLADPAGAEFYLRACVVNGCRSALRSQRVRSRHVLYERPAASADVAVLDADERSRVDRAVARLPRRQREVLVLRYYLDLADEEISQLMGVRPATVRSTVHRALDALGRELGHRS